MGHNTTTPRLITALKRAFCRSGFLTSSGQTKDNNLPLKCFILVYLAKEWGFQHITSSPRYPQSNGKLMIEATVKSMKKLIQHHRLAPTSMRASLLEPYFNTATHPHAGMAYLLHRSSSDGPHKTCFQPITGP